MNECFKCGISEKRALLFDAVSIKGIVKVCRKCNEEEKLPLIKTLKEIEEPQKETSKKYNFLSNYKNKFIEEEKEKLLREQEGSLREIIDKNFQKKIPEKSKQDNLVENFHWILMRARRSKKLTQKQLAEEISEPEIAIKLAEQGRIPRDSFNLIKKLENFLKINISKKPEVLTESSYSEEIDIVKREIKERFDEEVQFDEFTTRNLTLSDLQEIKNKKEEAKPQNKLLDKKDLTEEEMNEIIFGKR